MEKINRERKVVVLVRQTRKLTDKATFEQKIKVRTMQLFVDEHSRRKEGKWNSSEAGTPWYSLLFKGNRLVCLE